MAGYLSDLWVCDGSPKKLHKVVDGVIAATIGVNVPLATCVDKDNNVWSAARDSNAVVKITNNVVVQTVAVGTSPAYGMCIDKNNAVWVCNTKSNNVSKIENGIVTATIATGTFPTSIVADKNNAIWVCSTSGTVSKIARDVTSTVNLGKSYGLCVDRKNAIWVTLYDSAKVVKLVNGVVTATIAVGVNPMGIVADLDNNIFITNGGSHTVTKIAKDSVIATIGVNLRPSSICVDKDNNIYIANSQSNNISKIANGSIKPSTFSAGSFPYLYGDPTGMQYAMQFGVYAEKVGDQAMTGGL